MARDAHPAGSKMKKLFVNGKIKDGMIITGPDAHHIGFSLRTRPGERFVVSDGEGETAVMEAAGFTKKSVTMRLVRMLPRKEERRTRITLAICLPKGEKMDFITQKATELGVYAIQPLVSRYCVVNYDAAKREAKRERWQKIAGEAARQCEATLPPKVAPVSDFAGWVSGRRGALTLVCHEDEAARHIGLIDGDAADEYAVVIGSEGGFSPAEIDAAREAGAITVSLGPRVLRAETAAIVAITILQYERGDLKICREQP